MAGPVSRSPRPIATIAATASTSRAPAQSPQGTGSCPAADPANDGQPGTRSINRAVSGSTARVPTADSVIARRIWPGLLRRNVGRHASGRSSTGRRCGSGTRPGSRQNAQERQAQDQRQRRPVGVDPGPVSPGVRAHASRRPRPWRSDAAAAQEGPARFMRRRRPAARHGPSEAPTACALETFAITCRGCRARSAART